MLWQRSSSLSRDSHQSHVLDCSIDVLINFDNFLCWNTVQWGTRSHRSTWLSISSNQIQISTIQHKMIQIIQNVKLEFLIYQIINLQNFRFFSTILREIYILEASIQLFFCSCLFIIISRKNALKNSKKLI